MRIAKALACLLVLAAAPCPVQAQRITYWATSAMPGWIAVAPNGEVWWTENNGGLVGSIGVLETDGVLTEYPAPDTYPGGIVAGTAFMYVAGGAAGCLYRIGWLNHGDTYNDCSSPVSLGLQVAVDDEGYVYLSSSSGLKVFPRPGGPPSTFGSGFVEGVVRDPAREGGVVFAERDSGKIGFGDLDHGVQSECPLPLGSQPKLLAIGPEGAYYFTDENRNKIGRVDRQCHLSEWAVPGGLAPSGIAAGPDGNIWFTDGDFVSGAGHLGRLVPSTGAITQFAFFQGFGMPYGIAGDARGNLWITGKNNFIARFQVFYPGDVNDDGTRDVVDVFYLINFLFAGGPAPILP